jgi:hypothetical protein
MPQKVIPSRLCPAPDRGVAGDLQSKAPAQGGRTLRRLFANGSTEIGPPSLFPPSFTFSTSAT